MTSYEPTEENAHIGIRRIAWRTLEHWLGGGIMHWGASLSYYTLFSMAPLLVFFTGIAGMLFDASATQAEILSQLRTVLGSRGADIAATVLRQASFPGFGSFASVLTLLLSIVGATAVFNNLQGALNEIWGVKPVTGTVRNALRTRLISFLMILMTGGLIIVFFVFSTAASVMMPFIEARLPSGSLLVKAVDFTLSTAILWLAFAAIYRWLPDVEIAWRDVAAGALTTAVLFVVGKILIGAFLGGRDIGSVFGAAGSLFAVMVWIYYSAQIFLIGACFTQVWAHSRGRSIRPATYAGRVIQRVQHGDDDDS
jgi:membrane protein